MTIVKTPTLTLCLLAGALAVPCAAAPDHKAAAGSYTGSFCTTPSLFQPFGKFNLARLRPTPLHLTGPAYELTCALAVWQNDGAQAILNDNIVITTKKIRCVIFCNQAVYDKSLGTIDLQGSVRVTTTLAGTAVPLVSTGDSGTVALDSGTPQITLRSDPPEPHKHRRG